MWVSTVSRGGFRGGGRVETRREVSELNVGSKRDLTNTHTRALTYTQWKDSYYPLDFSSSTRTCPFAHPHPLHFPPIAPKLLVSVQIELWPPVSIDYPRLLLKQSQRRLAPSDDFQACVMGGKGENADQLPLLL